MMCDNVIFLWKVFLVLVVGAKVLFGSLVHHWTEQRNNIIHDDHMKKIDDSNPIPEPIDQVIRVSCVGDSITSYGCASADNMTYPAQLQRLLGTDQYVVSNHGRSGQTMLKQGLCGSNATNCEGNCSYWKPQNIDPALQSNPDIVTIMLGTNDAKGCNWYGPPNGSPIGWGVEFRSAFLDMISQFKSLPSQPKLYLIIPPPLVNPPKHPEHPPPFDMKKSVLNELLPFHIIPSIAMETGIDGIIDVWTALGGEHGYFSDTMTCDGCHPKDQAMTIIAKTIAKSITTTATTKEKEVDVDAKTRIV